MVVLGFLEANLLCYSPKKGLKFTFYILRHHLFNLGNISHFSSRWEWEPICQILLLYDVQFFSKLTLLWQTNKK